MLHMPLPISLATQFKGIKKKKKDLLFGIMPDPRTEYSKGQSSKEKRF